MKKNSLGLPERNPDLPWTWHAPFRYKGSKLKKVRSTKLIWALAVVIATLLIARILFF